MTQRSPQHLALAPSRLPWVTLTLAVILAAGLGSIAAAKGTSKSEIAVSTWTVTVDGKPAGVETLKTVRTASGKDYASGVVAPAKKGAVRIISHQQRDAGDVFKKYRRERKERLGKGVFAFRKGGVDRIVALNESAEPAELPHIGVGQIWDPVAWHTLARWGAALVGDEPITLPVLNVKERARGEAVASPMKSRLVTTEELIRAPLKVWKIKGLGSRAIEAGWLETGELAFVNDGHRELLIEGFSWKEPPPPQPEPELEPKPKEGEVAPIAPDAGDSPPPAAAPDAPSDPPADTPPPQTPPPSDDAPERKTP